MAWFRAYGAGPVARDISQTDIAAEDGDRDVTRRDFRIRWRSEIADALASNLSVIEDGAEFDVLNVIEVSRERRRGRLHAAKISYTFRASGRRDDVAFQSARSARVVPYR